MTTTNVALVRSLYDAFSRGDVAAVLGALSPDVVWNEAEGNPWADGNPYIGPEAVLRGVFARCASEWDGFAVQVEELLDAGETVVMLGRYLGTAKATGHAQRTQAAHVWRLAGGKVVRFQQYADTRQLATALGVIKPVSTAAQTT